MRIRITCVAHKFRRSKRMHSEIQIWTSIRLRMFHDHPTLLCRLYIAWSWWSKPDLLWWASMMVTFALLVRSEWTFQQTLIGLTYRHYGIHVSSLNWYPLREIKVWSASVRTLSCEISLSSFWSCPWKRFVFINSPAFWLLVNKIFQINSVWNQEMNFFSLSKSTVVFIGYHTGASLGSSD